MTLPPRHLVEDAVLHGVLPPAGAAAVVLGVALVAFGRKAAPVASAVAFVAALAVALYAKPVVPWIPNLLKRVEWIPVLAAGGALAGMFGRCSGFAWQTVLWTTVVALGIAKVCPGKYLQDPWWAVPSGAMLVSLVGFIPAVLSRRNPGACIPFAISACLFAAGGVALFAHSALLMDLAVLSGSAFFGLAAVCLFCRVDVSGALPGAAVVLGGVLLSAYYDMDEECKVPASSFLLVAGAPLLLAVAYLPIVNRLGGWKLRTVQLVCVCAPLAYALWAATAEKVDFENL
ncbi:MAG TPA: hypothetical protein VGJ05_14105 [Fimbriiglobus sp.]|jgi:hypothetical protein